MNGNLILTLGAERKKNKLTIQLDADIAQYFENSRSVNLFLRRQIKYDSESSDVVKFSGFPSFFLIAFLKEKNIVDVLS